MRYLGGEEIEARPPSWRYRLSRTSFRVHRKLLMTLLLLPAIAGPVSAFYMYNQSSKLGVAQVGLDAAIEKQAEAKRMAIEAEQKAIEAQRKAVEARRWADAVEEKVTNAQMATAEALAARRVADEHAQVAQAMTKKAQEESYLARQRVEAAEKTLKETEAKYAKYDKVIRQLEGGEDVEGLIDRLYKRYAAAQVNSSRLLAEAGQVDKAFEALDAVPEDYRDLNWQLLQKEIQEEESSAESQEAARKP